MKLYVCIIEPHTDLRTIVGGGVLAVLLACAGMAAGETWVVDADGGAGVNYTTIQAAVDAAGTRDAIGVWERDVCHSVAEEDCVLCACHYSYIRAIRLNSLSTIGHVGMAMVSSVRWLRLSGGGSGGVGSDSANTFCTHDPIGRMLYDGGGVIGCRYLVTGFSEVLSRIFENLIFIEKSLYVVTSQRFCAGFVVSLETI